MRITFGFRVASPTGIVHNKVEGTLDKAAAEMFGPGFPDEN